ncbi:hypothetical protein [Pedobacter jamesrossensis]|uniref:Uncharacterized protein n=1 Tax=Pedobacter jamesrossensis TaxID=1908238 RepID=A0ABV8NLZ2_9SPHI
MQLSLLDFTEPLTASYDIRQCFIEAAHYIMALNFQDEFELLYIDLKNKTGLKLIRDSDKILYPEIYDHLALITFSGIAVATLHKHGRGVVAEQLINLPYNATILDTEGLGAHYQLFKKYLKPVERFFLTKKMHAEWNTIINCFEFLLNGPVWCAIEFVAQILSMSKGKGLSHLEIIDKLCLQDFYPDLLVCLNNFSNKRYPLTKENLSMVF